MRFCDAPLKETRFEPLSAYRLIPGGEVFASFPLVTQANQCYIDTPQGCIDSRLPKSCQVEVVIAAGVQYPYWEECTGHTVRSADAGKHNQYFDR